MNSTLETRCCIVGGGAAGIMLRLLKATIRVDVIVLKKLFLPFTPLQDASISA